MIVDIAMPEDRGKALGLYEMMWFLGMVVGPGLGGVLAGVFTIAVPFFFCAVLAFLSMILVIFTVRETATTVNNACMPQTKPDLSKTNENPAEKLTPYPIVFLALCIVRFIIAFASSLIQPILSVYANESLGISEVGVGMLFTVMGIVTFFTTLPMGTVADKIGGKSTLVFGKSLEAISAFLIVFSGSFWPLLFVMMLRGFGRAAINPSITSMFSGVVSASMRGRGMGIFNTFQNIGLVIGAALGGFLYESSLEMPFVACAVMGFVGVMIVLLMVSEPNKLKHNEDLLVNL